LSDKGPSGSDEQVIRGILRYLVEHPDAKDTSEGIYKWWRSEGHINWGREEVQNALGLLTLEGRLTKRGKSPSEEFYGINKNRLHEVRRFLQQLGASS